MNGVDGAAGATGATGATGAAGAGFVYRSAYNPATAYSTNDVVTFNGSTYVSLQDSNSGNSPDSTPASWQLIAAAGSTGATGTAGSNGATGATGATGADGTDWSLLASNGVNGATGAIGATGSARRSRSDRSDRLERSPTASNGVDGAAGATGATGAAGATGQGFNFVGSVAAWYSISPVRCADQRRQHLRSDDGLHFTGGLRHQQPGVVGPGRSNWSDGQRRSHRRNGSHWRDG